MYTNLLIIRPGAIGDALLAFPVLRALRAQSTQPHITLVSNPNVLPLALAFGIAEEVSDYGHIQWSELFSITGIHTQTMRNLLQRIDLAICWLRDPDGLVERNLHIAGIKQVIVAPGRPTVETGVPARGTPTLQGVPLAGTQLPAETRCLHVVEYLGQTMGLQIHPHVETPFTLPGSHDSPHLYDQYIAIHPGSGGAHKCWPAHHFASVIEQLCQRGHSILLLSGTADQERVRDILSTLRETSVKQLVNEPLLELASHLQGCRCYLGNDSGITHLAALLGVPTVALFGPSDPNIWRPLGPSVTVIQESLLNQLSIDIVLNALQS